MQQEAMLESAGAFIRRLRARIGSRLWRTYHVLVCRKDRMQQLYCSGMPFGRGCEYCEWVEFDPRTKQQMRLNAQEEKRRRAAGNGGV
jgi:hypothetical protein